jgi:replicative DNA helicase
MTTTVNVPVAYSAEQYVLCGVLAEPKVLPGVRDLLQPQDFSVEAHRVIFSELSWLYEHGIPLDRAAVYGRLKDRRDGDYASELLNLDPLKIIGIEGYCRAIADKAAVRKAAFWAESFLERCQVLEASELATEAQSFGKLVSSEAGRTLSARTPEEVCEAAGGINAFLGSAGDVGMPIPWKGLHFALSGLRKAQLIFLGARPGVGKTAFAWQIAEHVALNGKRVLFVSAEMSDGRLLQRAVLGLAQVPAQKWRAGKLSETESYHLMDAWGCISEMGDRLLICDKSSPTVDYIAAQCRRLASQGRPIDLLCVDYVQIMGSVTGHESRTQEVAAISRGLNDLKKQFNIPVLALCQLSRETDKGAYREPVLADLKESGQLEQDADVVAFLWPQKPADMDNEEKSIYPVWWAIKKHRDGPMRRGILQFDRARTRFEEEGL